MNRQPNQITAIYVRVDGNKINAEDTISYQKASLAKYAWEHNLTNIRIYSDCGFNGYDMERPAFLRLENDIRRGKVSALVLFDLTRLSKDYIVVSEWIEKFLPQHHVGLYAVRDGIAPETGPVPICLPIAALFGGGR